MSNVFLDYTGLSHYDAKIKSVAAGKIGITSRTITLSSIDNTALGTITVPDTVIDVATQSSNGLMSSTDKIKLDGVTTGATKVESNSTNGKITVNGSAVTVYAHPTHTALTSGLYKITTNSLGHVTAGTAVVKSDITSLGIPGSATVVAKSSTNGNILVDSSEVTVYTHPSSYTAHDSGMYKITVNAEGHVTATTAIAKADITGLGIASTDTATTSANGLMSATQVTKLNGIATGAQVNVLEKVSVNGSALTINSKGVNIDLSGYALKTDIASAVNYKGSVSTYADLPTSPSSGDMYNVETADSTYGIDAGTNVIWNGSSWDPMAPMIEFNSISNTDIDNLFTSAS